MVDKMEKVSRVINGISIQQSLLDGKVSTDALISELLNFGNVTATQLLAIDIGKLTQLAKDIQELPKKLPEDVLITKMEDKLKLISEMVEKSNGVTELNAPNPDYLNDVKTLRNTIIDWSELELFLSYWNGLSDVVTSLKTTNIKKKWHQWSFIWY
ncbi:hypothetical protein B9Z55_008558 [Caenorhabditis nigoni]|uniref:Domain of unknown function WSN domain-containing protein n=1 Tax=Caenorhabditis nigoni TaxID=1611254 RepID=A0A2G5UN33_9PELO|nr:hypothetical protein B9Z55_008558 [Caenorhabditis nigoni]